MDDGLHPATLNVLKFIVETASQTKLPSLIGPSHLQNNSNNGPQRGPARKRPVTGAGGPSSFQEKGTPYGGQRNISPPRGQYNQRNDGYGSSRSPPRFHKGDFSQSYGQSQRPHSLERVGVQGYEREGKRFDAKREFSSGHGLSPPRSNQGYAQGNYGGSFQRGSSPGYSGGQGRGRNNDDVGQQNFHNRDSPHGPPERFDYDSYAPNRGRSPQRATSPGYDSEEFSRGANYGRRGGNLDSLPRSMGRAFDRPSGYNEDNFGPNHGHSSRRPQSPDYDGGLEFDGRGGHHEDLRPTGFVGRDTSNNHPSRHSDGNYELERSYTAQRAPSPVYRGPSLGYRAPSPGYRASSPGYRGDQVFERRNINPREMSPEGFRGQDSSYDKPPRYNDIQGYQPNYGHSPQREPSPGFVRGGIRQDSGRNLVGCGFGNDDNYYPPTKFFKRSLTPERRPERNYHVTNEVRSRNINQASNMKSQLLDEGTKLGLSAQAFRSIIKEGTDRTVITVVDFEEPAKRLSNNQAKAVRDFICKMAKRCPQGQVPEFVHTLADKGAVYLKCLNSFSTKWLVAKVPRMSVPGLQQKRLKALALRNLKAIREKSGLYKARVQFWLPSRLSETYNTIEKLFNRFSSQNRGLKTNLWTLANRIKEPKGVNYVVMIDQQSLLWLEKNDFQATFENIKLRIQLLQVH